MTGLELSADTPQRAIALAAVEAHLRGVLKC